MVLNKKALIEQIGTIFIFAFVLGLIVAGVFALTLIVPPVTSSLDAAIGQIGRSVAPDPNITEAYNVTFVPVQNSLPNFEWISFGIIFMSFLGFTMCCFYVKTYPFLAIMWIAVIFVIGFASIYISNAYQEVRLGQGLNYTSYEFNDYFITYLPHFIFAFGFLSGFILFVIVARESPGAEVNV